MTAPALLGVTPENIPAALKATPRWGNWQAVWSAKRNKYDKIPKHPRGYGISTARPDKWRPFDEANDALLADFSGVGYLMAPGDGLVGIDMDRCIADGVIAPWAQEIIDAVGSYTEVSPSGNGLRIFTRGTTEFDWNNHELGIEVYSGHTARFLTVTGAHVPGTPADITTASAGVLSGLATQHARYKEAATALSRALPEIAAPADLPALSELGLPHRVGDYMTLGLNTKDRSDMLQESARALAAAGLSAEEIYSILANNPFTMADALGKRGDDTERALLYLWVHQAQPGKATADSRGVLSADAFDDLTQGSGEQAPASPVSSEKIARFTFSKPSALRGKRRLTWIVKGVIPQAEVGAVYGESGAGKSFFVLDVVAAVAQGIGWRGHRVKQGGVAYVCAEGALGFLDRIKAYEDFHGVDFDNLPFHMLDDAPSLLERTDVKDLVAALRALGPLSVIVLDTLAQMTPGADENSGQDMGRALAHARAIHRATGAMVLLVAHSGKTTGRGIRGWSGIKGALDVDICTERSGNARSATITKLKDGGGEGTEYPFELDIVELGKDEDGDPITSCVLKACGKATPGASNGKGVPWVNLIAEAAQNLYDLSGPMTLEELRKEVLRTVPSQFPDTGNHTSNAGREIRKAIVAGKLVDTDGALTPRESA